MKISDEAVLAAAKLSDRYISDRYLPDKAIDLIDEAGSRVRLINSQLPPAAKELDKELRKILKEKDDAVRSQDFDKAGELRDREMEIKAEIRAIAQSKAGGSGANGEEPVVTEEDIAFSGSVELSDTLNVKSLLKLRPDITTKAVTYSQCIRNIND